MAILYIYWPQPTFYSLEPMLWHKTLHTFQFHSQNLCVRRCLGYSTPHVCTSNELKSGKPLFSAPKW